MPRTKLVVTLICLSALAPACAYKIYVRGVHDSTASRIGPDSGLHIQVRTDGDEESNELLASKIEKILDGRGFKVVPESEAEAYLFFEYTMEDLVKRRYMHPTPGASSGIGTTASEGPFVHTFSVSVVDAESYLHEGKTKADVMWAGGAVLDTTSIRSPKVVDLLVVALFDQFPEDTGQTIKVGMNLSDSRARELREDVP